MSPPFCRPSHTHTQHTQAAQKKESPVLQDSSVVSGRALGSSIAREPWDRRAPFVHAPLATRGGDVVQGWGINHDGVMGPRQNGFVDIQRLFRFSRLQEEQREV